MSLQSVVDRLSGWGTSLIVFVGIVCILYWNRSFLARLFLRKGIVLAGKFFKEVLAMVGASDPKWVLVQFTDKVQMLGLVVASSGTRLAVFLPSTPQLVPGKLVFVNAREVQPLRGLGLQDGIEALISLGAMESNDVLDHILSQMED